MKNNRLITDFSAFSTLFSVYLRATVLLLVLFHTPANAQREPNDFNEFSIFGGIGLTFIPYEFTPDARYLTGSDLHSGIGYTHFLHESWGMFIGAGTTLYNVGNAFDIDLKNSGLTDSNGYMFDLFTIAGYKENHRMLFLTVPVMLHYEPKSKKQRWEWWNKPQHVFYAMGGVKTSISFNNKYKAGIGTINNRAYYPELNNWAATQKFAGLGEFDGNSAEGEFNLGLSFVFSLEAGIKWKLNGYKFLYTSVYFDYGLNNINKSEINRMPIHNDINVERFTDFLILNYPDKIQMRSIGINARLAFYRAPNSCKHDPYRFHIRKAPKVK